MKIGSEIRFIRKELKLTQKQMALRLGISQPVLSLIESGKSSLTLQNLKVLIEEFGVSCLRILMGHEQYNAYLQRNQIPLLSEGELLQNMKGDMTLPEGVSYYRLPLIEGELLRLMQLKTRFGRYLNKGDILIGKLIRSTEQLPPGLLAGLSINGHFKLFWLFEDAHDENRWRLVDESGMTQEDLMDRSSQPFILKILGRMNYQMDQDEFLHSSRIDLMESEINWLKRNMRKGATGS